MILIAVFILYIFFHGFPAKVGDPVRAWFSRSTLILTYSRRPSLPNVWRSGTRSQPGSMTRHFCRRFLLRVVVELFFAENGGAQVMAFPASGALHNITEHLNRAPTGWMPQGRGDAPRQFTDSIHWSGWTQSRVWANARQPERRTFPVGRRKPLKTKPARLIRITSPFRNGAGAVKSSATCVAPGSGRGRERRQEST